jgi:hypothetical protein
MSLVNGSIKNASLQETNVAKIVDAMWNMEEAVKISSQYLSTIPLSNANLIKLIERYKKSYLYEFHKQFDAKENLPPGVGSYLFYHDSRLSQGSRNMLYHPVPTFLQPLSLRRFIQDCIRCGWHPKHIGNGICDLYKQNSFNFPFHKYPPETKGNFYARIFSILAMLEEGKVEIS